MAKNIQVKYFGSLVDLTGKEGEVLEEVNDVSAVRTALTQRYPALAARSYSIAVEKKMVQGNMPLQDGQTIALMPPYSGG